MHSAAKRQKMSWKGILGMNIIEIAVKNAADPSINDDTLVTLPFYFMLLPISIAITVPMMLQGPPMQLPIRNMAAQYCQAMLVSAKETINITTELISSRGLRKRARLLYLSTRKPTAVPPIRLPKSIILAMQPFYYAMLPPLSPKKIGSQKRSPYMQPFRQEYPKTYKGTRGRHMTENIPYFNADCGLSSVIFTYCPPFSFPFCCPYSSVSVEPSIKLPSLSSPSSSSGFSFKNTIISNATPMANPPVTTKFHTHDVPLPSSKLQRLEAMILPTLAFMAHTPISTPFLFFENQFPKIPIMPGHPVAWKKPFMHISTQTNTGEKKPLIAKMIGKSKQLTEASISPAMMYVLRETLWMILPSAAMPKEQEMRQSASTMPRKSPLTPNYTYNCCLEQDHPSRKECRLAQPRKVSRKAVAFSQNERDVSIQTS